MKKANKKIEQAKQPEPKTDFMEEHQKITDEISRLSEKIY